MLADIASQKVYNYWVRIGELINSFFLLRGKSNNNFFHSAIEEIPEEYRESENYLWLKNFKESEYIELYKIRRDIVHTISSDTNFKYRHSAVVTNKEKMYELQTEHENIAPFYKKQISLSILGFEKTLLLLEEVN
jgi:hypothetical protein